MSILQVISIVIGVFLTSWFIRFLWTRRRLYMLSSNIPGPRNYPLIGMAHLLFGTTEDMFKAFLNIFAEHPDICKCWFGPELFYLVSKPEYLEKILNHPGAISRTFAYNPISTLLGSDGLFLGDTLKWKIARKFLAPSFNQKLLNRFVLCFNEQALTLSKMLKTNSDSAEFVDIAKYVSNCIADVVSETLFDCKINAQERELPIGKLLDKILEIGMVEGSKPWFRLGIIFKRTSLYKKKMRVIDKINEITSEIFDLNNVDVDDKLFKDENTTKFKSLIQVLFTRKLKEPQYSNENIKHEINTFFIAAIDTSTITICFTLVLLAMHPEIQARVRSEVIEITKGRDDKSITAEDLQRLKYTERVIKESSRLFPSGSFISRKFDSDLILDDIIIPKGANAFLGLYIVHRDAKYWPEPLKFDPDRFLPEEMSKRHPYTYVAFSGGPRNCIGYRFAMMMIKVVIASMVMNFEISTSCRSVEEVELKLDALTKPKNGYKLFMKPRE